MVILILKSREARKKFGIFKLMMIKLAFPDTWYLGRCIQNAKYYDIKRLKEKKMRVAKMVKV